MKRMLMHKKNKRTLVYAFMNPAVLPASALLLTCVLALSSCPSIIVIKENNEKIDTPQDMQYTITFNSGGGSNVDEVTDEAGTSVQKPQDPVRPGYIFQGWYSAASGGTKYEWPHTLTGSLTMYAHWQESGEYTITFDSQGGSETSAASGNEGTSISRPQDSVRPGYIFQGWYSAASGGTKYEWPHTLTGSLTMYAHWQESGEYTITFDSQGGSETSAASGNEGALISRPQDSVRPGYIFQGWYSAASGGTKYEWPHTLTGSLTMYAHWQESGEYTITFDSQGGSETSAASGNEGTSISRPQDSVRPGYIFQGWYSAASGGTKYEWPHTLTGSLTMYAHWSGIAYTVEYNANGGTGSTASTGHVYGVESSLAQNGFTRGGYNFAGWNSQVDGLGINYAAGGKVTDLVSEAGGKVTLYARWINDDNLPPMISGTVSIDGDATEGADLSANIDNLGGDGAVSYQWQRGGSVYGDYTAIAGANGRTYTVAADDLGKYIMVMVIRAGYEGAVKSEARGPVGSHFIEGSVIIEYAIEGVDIVDVVLNASIDDLGGDGAVSYQWQTSDFETGPFSNIIGAVYKTYTLVKADLNKWFKVNVTREGYQGSLSSNLFYSGGIVDPTALIWVAPAANTTGISSIKGIAFGNEGVNARFVAVGEGGKAAYSPDGKTWTASGNTGFGNSAITAVAFGNEGVNARFVAVGEGGKAAYSTDGVTWTAVSDTKLGDSKVTSIAFGNEASDVSGRFVAVTADGKAAYSPDGVTWTAVSDTKFDGAEIFCIAFGGEGVNAKFVAVGRFGMAAYSLDGASWTKVSDTKFSGGGSDIITGVSYGGEGVNARFVAVGTSGRAAYSTNGVTWTAVSDAKFDGADIQGITFGNCGNGRFLAVGEGGKTAYSPDGETWTKVNANSALGNSIICAPVYGAGRFVAFDYTRKLTVYSNLQE